MKFFKKILFAFSLLNLILLFKVLYDSTPIEGYENGNHDVDEEPFSENYIKIYAKIFNDSETYKYNIDSIIEKTIKNKYKKKDVSILDAGTGVGNHYGYLYNMYDTIGVDRSKNILKQAEINNPNGKFLKGNIINENLFKPASFTHIVAMHDTLYHNKNIENILENFYYWLKKNGTISLHIWDENNLDPSPRSFSEYYIDDDNIKHSLTLFKGFKHDAWWNKNKYCEVITFDNGKSVKKCHKMFIYPKKEMINMIIKKGFKLVDIIKKKNIDSSDIYIFKKKI